MTPFERLFAMDFIREWVASGEHVPADALEWLRLEEEQEERMEVVV